MLQNNDAGALTRVSNDIVEHPEYVANQAHADIAIVSFDPVEFSNTVILFELSLWSMSIIDF